MIWGNWQNFFYMGGYALYVWGSLIAVLLCMTVEVSALSLRNKAARAQLNNSRKVRK
jgi:heme exporter protein D